MDSQVYAILQPYIAIPVALLVVPLLFRLLSGSSSQSIPTVSPLEYLPNGVLHSIVKDARSLQLTLHNAVKQYGGVFYSWFGSNKMLVTINPSDIAHALTSDKFKHVDSVHQTFHASAPGGLISMPADDHQKVRKALRRSFTPDMLSSWQPQMNPSVLELCGKLKGMAKDPKKVIDMSKMIHEATFRILMTAVFATGMSTEEREDFLETILQFFDETVKEIWGYPVRQFLTVFGVRNRFFALKNKINSVARALIQKRREETEEEMKGRHPDILDIFLSLNLKDEERLTSLIVEFIVKGSHTISQSLAWSIYQTCCNERVVSEIDNELKKVLGDKPWDEAVSKQDLQKLPYLHKVWKETHRLHQIAGPGFAREATSEVTLPGTGARLKKGSQVLCFSPGTNVDATLWSDAASFKPERWGSGDQRGEGDRAPAGAFVPYGLGKHSCAGRFLAEYEGPLILAELHRRFRFELACRPDEIVNCSKTAETAMFASKKGGELDMGVPVRVLMK